ncbi:Heterokaryon incompatibility protein 6, OR allele [Pseudoneurospora amorphoporcata]|uniref:Heterokaryon incompatibility protein 6, OR allele n=1 Tax=Pseudoneurospora amorphoporcata TaxID=241081 RepID=A0AAN6NN28_9PEZI|nr:Heterokaryon incompatibility protein 6, OR allele [Pseudoneurospora amorphoporcata]
MADTAQTDIIGTNTQARQGTPFTYDLVPLRDPSTSIRLLELYPAQNFTDDLECRIYSRPLGETGKYYALSYAWGENEKTHEISVVNFPSETTDSGPGMQDPLNYDGGRACGKLSLPITASLDICLRHLRALFLSDGLKAILWIDQICINQDSDGEKSHQVQLMRNIYSAAHMVLAWLGPLDDHSDEVVDTWSQIFQMWLNEAQTRPLKDASLSLDIEAAQPWLIDITDKAIDLYERINSYEKLGKWQTRGWFSRVWIIQEFCLCNQLSIVCGENVISEAALMISMKIIRQTFLTPAERFAKRPYSLQDLLGLLYSQGDNNFYTTRYRDRIYGLLGLATDVDELGIIPDYSGTSTAEVLTEVARAIIERGRPNPEPGSPPPLSVLRYAQLPKTEPDNMEEELLNRVPLPTWVPDWRNNLAGSYEGEFVVDQPYTPSRNSSKPAIVPTSNSNVLGLRGYLINIVEATGDCLPIVVENMSWIVFAESMKTLWHGSYSKTLPVYRNALRHEEALWRTPIGDIMEDGWSGRRAVSRDIEKFRQFEQLLRDIDPETDQVSHMRMAIDVLFRSGYMSRLTRMIGKRPYLTEKGYLGMGPKDAQPRDLVVVFYGDRVAYVIRPAPEHGENTYTLVGEAYCDGIMDGEIADTAEKRDFFLV